MNSQLTKQRTQLTRLIAGFFLVALLARWGHYLLLHQLESPPLTRVKADNLFWAFHLLGIPQWLLSNWWAALGLDLSLLAGAIGTLVYPQKRGFPILFTVAFVLYYVAFNSAMTHHAHPSAGFLFFGLLVCLKANRNFTFGFYAVRYYACFAMFSAAMWKIGRGAAFYPAQLTNILKNQHIDYISVNPDHWYSDFVFYLLAHPTLLAWLWYGAILLEFVFLVGFFTRRFDKFLILCFLGFFIGDYIIMNLYFFEFCIFVLAFLRWDQLENEYERNSLKEEHK